MVSSIVEYRVVKDFGLYSYIKYGSTEKQVKSKQLRLV